MAVWQNIAGTWKQGTVWQNVFGTWKQCNVWQNIAGTWRNLSTFFTPDGGDQVNEQNGYASVTLSCSTPATWTYTQTSGGTGTNVNLASGGTSTSITFSASATTKVGRQGRWSVTGSSNGVVRNFTVTCTAFATDGGNNPLV